MEREIAVRKFPLKRLIRMIFLKLAKVLPLSKFQRPFLYRLGGVKIEKGDRRVRLGEITFDTLHPEDISIGAGTVIVDGCTIVTHYLMIESFLKPEDTEFLVYRGKVNIGQRVYIGTNVIIAKDVTIGDGAIIAAGSIVTKDIPPFTVWGGNPAKFIKNRIKNE